MKIFKKLVFLVAWKKNWDVTLNLCTLLVNARYFGEYVNIFLGYRHGVRFDPISTDGVHYIDHRLYSGDDVVHYIWPSHAWLEVSLDLISIPAIPRCTLWACSLPLSSPLLLFLTTAPTHHCALLMVIPPRCHDYYIPTHWLACSYSQVGPLVLPVAPPQRRASLTHRCAGCHSSTCPLVLPIAPH
jgi:hypothetical protein